MPIWTRRQLLLSSGTTVLSACGGSFSDDARPIPPPTPPQESDVVIVTNRVVGRLLSAPPVDSTLASYRANFDSSTGLWSDLNYADAGAGSTWSPLNHLKRLNAMALGWKTSSSAYFQNADLVSVLTLGLQTWSSQSLTAGNWWFNDIAAPQELGEILLVLGADFRSTQLSSVIDDLMAKMSKAYRQRTDVSAFNAGANRVDRAYASLMRGLLITDESLIQDSVSQISDTLVQVPYRDASGLRVEGVQQDWAYLQHGPQLYAAGYGLVYLATATYGGYVAATKFAFPSAAVSTLIGFLLEGQQRWVRGRAWSPTAMGRSVSRAGVAASDAVNLLVPLQDTLSLLERSDAAYASRSDYKALKAFGDRLQSSQSRKSADESLALTDGFTYFYSADAAAFHSSALAVFVKTSSINTNQQESGNGEGLKNLLLSDGSTFFYRSGNELGDSSTNNLLPVMNWYAIPGVTAEQGSYSLQPSANWGVRGTASLLGGLGSGAMGMVAFDSARRNVNARKAWFFASNALIALGAGITAPSATGTVMTTLNQCLLGTGNCTWANSSGATGTVGPAQSLSLIQPSWVHHGGLGYHFLQAAPSVSLLTQSRSGAWSDINTAQSKTVLNANVFVLGIAHGSAFATPQTYAYAVSAVDSAAQIVQATPAVTVVNNSAEVQAIETAEGLYAVCWDAGSADGQAVQVQSDGALLALVKPGPALTIQVGHLNATPSGTRTLTVVVKQVVPAQPSVSGAGLSVLSVSSQSGVSTVTLQVSLSDLPLSGAAVVF